MIISSSVSLFDLSARSLAPTHFVERTYGWLNRCRRLVKDYENLTRNHAAFIILAMIRLMLRRIVSGVPALLMRCTLAGSRVFQVSSAMRAFWAAVSEVKGGSGGLVKSSSQSLGNFSFRRSSGRRIYL